MSKRDSFIFYRSFFEATKPLKKSEKAELFDAICIYALDQQESELKPLATAMFALIQPQLKANYNKFLNGSKQKPSKPEAKPEQKVSKTEGNVNVNSNVNANEKKDTKKMRFTPPALSDVLKYMEEKGMSQTEATTQADKFINHYTSNGWKVGKNKMIDWRAAVRSNWLKDITKSNGQSEYTYKEVVWIHSDHKDKRTMEDFKRIPNSTNWVAI